MHNIVIVDDHEIFRETLRHTLNAVDLYNVVGEAENPSKVMALLDDTVDIMILDISMGNYDVFDLIKRVGIHHPNIKIIILSMHDEERIVRNALATGVNAYISKDSKMSNLITAIDRALAGHKYISENISEMLVNSFNRSDSSPHELLTSRELHVFTMLGKGVSINQIASDLKLSAKTISSHKARLMQKMNIQNNAELIKYYLNSELNESKHIEMERSY